MISLLYILALVGCTLIITDSDLFDAPKEFLIRWAASKKQRSSTEPNWFDFIPNWVDKFVDLTCCAQCIGFWVGFVAYFFYPLTGLNCFLDGCLVSGIAYLFQNLANSKD